MTKRILMVFALLALLLGSAATADAGDVGVVRGGAGPDGAAVSTTARDSGVRGPGGGRDGMAFARGPSTPSTAVTTRTYYPYAAYPPYASPVVVQQDPQIYIQQDPQVSVQQAPAPQAAPLPPDSGQPQPSQFWYYCEDARGYFPYVHECPRGWMTVVPPASQR